MNVAMVGTGQMGEAVEQVALDRGHVIETRFHSERPLEGTDAASMNDVDVAIDFSLPSLALTHIQQYCEWGVPAVVGTTGWYDELDAVEGLVEEHGASLLYSPNFSMGIAVVRQALEGVLPLLDELEDYDAFVHEFHHTNKVDSPSGTAEMLGGMVVEGLERKDHVETETQHDRIDSSALHVTSTRAGTIYGKHTIGFDGPYDEIAVEHQAKNRQGFAAGAVRATWRKRTSATNGTAALNRYSGLAHSRNRPSSPAQKTGRAVSRASNRNASPARLPRSPERPSPLESELILGSTLLKVRYTLNGFSLHAPVASVCAHGRGIKERRARFVQSGLLNPDRDRPSSQQRRSGSRNPNQKLKTSSEN